MSKHGEFLQAMLEYAEARGLQVKQVGIAFRGKRPDYCIVDDDLQPYDLQPTESTNHEQHTNNSPTISNRNPPHRQRNSRRTR